MSKIIIFNFNLTYILIILGLILTAIGGYLDYIDKPRWGLSKQHYWNDGGILILLAIFLQKLSE